MTIKPDGTPDPAPAPAPPRPSRRRRWLLVCLGAVGGGAILLGAVGGYIVNMDLPDVRALEDYQPPTITQILAQDGRPVHQFAEQKRIVVPLDRISPILRQAVISVEDASFNRHVGVDPKALFRALLRDVRERRWAEGGSTLTQQLAKILFLRPDKRLRRKIQEAILAMQIEKTYTKEEILEFYLNQMYLGHGRYGVEAAAQFYFATSAADIGLDQAALLAGIFQRPEAYSPIRSPDRAARRRNHVLTRMAAEGYISAEEADRVRGAPIVVARVREGNPPAPYFAEEIRKTLAPRYGDEMLLREGMVIRTGFDLDLQEAATRALSRGLRELDKRRGFRRPEQNILRDRTGSLDSWQHPEWDQPPHQGDLVRGLVTRVSSRSATVRVGRLVATLEPRDAAWTGRDDFTRLLRPGDVGLFEVLSVGSGEELSLALDQEPEVEGAVLALDPKTGDIKAMVGGWSFRRSQFNRAVQAQRQCGSAFKPFIYAAAIDSGRTASDLLFDEPTIFVDPATGAAYQPENYERRYEGVVTLRKALEESLNIPTIQLLNDVGYAATVELAKTMGITSPLHPYPSLGLGSSEVSLMELTAAYGVFPTGGILTRPRYFSEVRDREGNVLEETRVDGREALRADVAAVLVSMLEGVLQRGTAATGARPGSALAGKTGTTDDYTDAWFIGFSPSIVIGVWVGHDRKITLGPRETGARAALPIWSAVMDAWLAGHRDDRFPEHPDVVKLQVDRDTGLRVAPELSCRTPIMESFLKGTEAERPCTVAAHARLTLPYYLQRFPLSESGGLDIPDAELDRLLGENPFHLDLIGRTSLNVLNPSGVSLVRLARGERHGRDVGWGFLRPAEQGGGSDEEAEEQAVHQLLPAVLPPLGAGASRYVGIDGRSAAVIPIKYP